MHSEVFFRAKSGGEPLVYWFGPVQDLTSGKTLVLYRPVGEELRLRAEADFYAIYERTDPPPFNLPIFP